jgi:DNA-binding SARP family transcriptional activator
LEQALLWLQMGFCYALRGENARDGYRAGLNAYFLARKAQDLPLQVHALLVAMLPMTYVGEFSEAEEMRSRAEGLLHKVVNRELHAVFLKNWSELALFRGRLETAGGLVRQMNEEIDRLGLLYFQVPGMYSELLYHIYAGNEAETEEIGRRLLDMSRSMDHSFSSGLCSILLAMHAYRQRQWSRARELVSAGKEIFSMPDTISPFHYHEACLLAGLVHLHLENPDMAEKLFRSALRYALRVSNHLIRVETLLSLALLMENSSRFREACAYLESGFSIASNRNYTHFMIIGPLDQIMVCALALRAGTRSSAQYADHLLRAGLIEAAQPQELRGLQNHPSPEVRRSAQTAMLERHRRNRPVLSIETLGGFRVWSGQRPLSEEEWQGNQAKTLLKALVSQTRQGKAHKGLLIDELWPDSDPGAGEKTFKAALHRLRRSLEPDMDPGFGSSYIHLKSGRAFLDRELCRIDTERFLELASHAEDQLGSGEWRPALKTYEQALALYKGDFLPADPDRDWTMGMRELLRQRHINVLLEAGRGFERCGSKGKAARLYERALECEPLLEEACRRLMVLHADQGRRSKALQVYARCCETLRDSLGIEPDPLTTSLYRRIRG